MTFTWNTSSSSDIQFENTFSFHSSSFVSVFRSKIELRIFSQSFFLPPDSQVSSACCSLSNMWLRFLLLLILYTYTYEDSSFRSFRLLLGCVWTDQLLLDNQTGVLLLGKTVSQVLSLSWLPIVLCLKVESCEISPSLLVCLIGSCFGSHIVEV